MNDTTLSNSPMSYHLLPSVIFQSYSELLSVIDDQGCTLAGKAGLNADGFLVGQGGMMR
jgi:hypothetical protein